MNALISHLKDSENVLWREGKRKRYKLLHRNLIWKKFPEDLQKIIFEEQLSCHALTSQLAKKSNKPGSGSYTLSVTQHETDLIEAMKVDFEEKQKQEEARVKQEEAESRDKMRTEFNIGKSSDEAKERVRKRILPHTPLTEGLKGVSST